MDFRTQLQRQRNMFQAKYSNNKVLHIIIFCVMTYVLLLAINFILAIVLPAHKSVMDGVLSQNLGLQPFRYYLHHPWVLLSYFWLHKSFWLLLTNMLWFYCFGSVIQAFVGYKEVIPLFLFSGIASGVCFVLTSSFLGEWLPEYYILSSSVCVMAFAVAAFVLVPHHRFYLTERLSFAMWVVFAVYFVLNVLTVINNYPLLILLIFGGLSGAGYIALLRNGYSPGLFFYKIGNRIESSVTPDDSHENKPNAKRAQTIKMSRHQVVENPTPEYIDMLLDKINQKGYKALTPEERQSLKNAGKTNGK